MKLRALVARLLLPAALLFSSGLQAQDTRPAGEPATGVFPFYSYAARYQMWEFTPLDQGGRLVQLQVIGSERDDDIVKAIRAPGFFSPWGDPIRWDSLEKTELEKSVWLNRWYFLPCFARLYRLTGDKTYLRELLAFVRKWRDENPPPADLPAYFATRKYNWRDMQVAWRTQNLAWCYFLGRDGFSAEERRELYALIQIHAANLLAYFGKQRLIENNHQSHGATAMLYAALLFPEIPEAAALKAKALEILTHHLDKAFYADGNSVELCPGYYPFFASIFRDAFLLCRANQIPPPPRSEERLRQFYEFIHRVRQPDNRMPPINDSSESDAGAALRIYAELLGLPEAGPAAGSHLYPLAHQAVMRDPNPAAPAYVLLDAGPQVLAHWHGGKLGFHLWFWDRPLLIDSGISNYDDPLKKSWYLKPEAHNTLLVDGKGDYDRATTRIDQRPMAGSQIVHWETNTRFDWAVMTHAGFQDRPAPVAWTRHFVLLKNLGALIVDQIESAGEHDYTWLFHLTPCTPVLDTVTHAAFTRLPEKNLLLQPGTPATWSEVKFTPGTMNRQSKNYPNPVATYRTRGQNMTRAFLLLPVAGRDRPAVHVEQKVTTNSVLITIAGATRAVRLQFTRSTDASGKTHYALGLSSDDAP